MKNAMGVGIPGVPERGVAMCVAVGLAGGDASRGMDVLGSVTEAHHQQALDLLPLIEVKMDDTRTNLYVETILESDEDTVRVITDGNHDRIVAVEHAPFEPYISQNFTDDSLESYTIKDFRRFADSVELDKLAFLKDGVNMNLAISKAGEKLPWGKSMETLAEKGYMGDSLLLNVQTDHFLRILCADERCAAACYDHYRKRQPRDYFDPDHCRNRYGVENSGR